MKLQNTLISLSLLCLGAGCTNTQPISQTITKTDSIFSAESFTREDRAELYESLKWSPDCEEEFAEYSQISDGGLAFYPIDSETYLLRATCDVYAYQSTMIFALVKPATTWSQVTGSLQTLYDFNPETKSLEPIYVADTKNPIVLGFDSFDPETKKLTIFTKDRGVGDCGSRTTYAVQSDALVLIKEEYQSCEDADEFHLKNPNAEEMPEWPVIYEKK